MARASFVLVPLLPCICAYPGRLRCMIRPRCIIGGAQRAGAARAMVLVRADRALTGKFRGIT